MTNHMDLATLQQQARTQQEIETAITRIFAAEDDGLREALTALLLQSCNQKPRVTDNAGVSVAMGWLVLAERHNLGETLRLVSP